MLAAASLARQSRFSYLPYQWRSFSSTCGRLAEQTATKEAPASPSTLAAAAKPPPSPVKTAQKPVPPPPLPHAPRSYGKRVETFTPEPLSRPIGLPYAPEAGQNTGTDTRSLKQRRADFVDIQKHAQRREYLTHQISRPYFREWTNLNLHQGKTFFAPPRPFRADLSLYFPNIHGRTASDIDDGSPFDTTPVLTDRVSIVSVFSGRWAEDQTASFVSSAANPELAKLVERHADVAQHVRVNYEPSRLKALLVRMFLGGIRKTLKTPEEWRRYFVIRTEFSHEIREAVGLLNSKVGYVYLVDGECRIRWAGSAVAVEEEKKGLVAAAQRLLKERGVEVEK